MGRTLPRALRFLPARPGPGGNLNGIAAPGKPFPASLLGGSARNPGFAVAIGGAGG